MTPCKSAKAVTLNWAQPAVSSGPGARPAAAKSEDPWENGAGAVLARPAVLKEVIVVGIRRAAGAGRPLRRRPRLTINRRGDAERAATVREGSGRAGRQGTKHN